MRKPCSKCGVSFDDEFRTTVCPHETFPANDGMNNFEHHNHSLLITPSLQEDIIREAINETVVTIDAQILAAAREYHRCMVTAGNRSEGDKVRQSVTPELHNAMMNLVNILNIDAADRAGKSGFQAMQIQGHKTYDRGTEAKKIHKLFIEPGKK